MTLHYREITIADTSEDNFIEAKITGKLTEKDYEIIIRNLKDGSKNTAGCVCLS